MTRYESMKEREHSFWRYNQGLYVPTPDDETLDHTIEVLSQLSQDYPGIAQGQVGVSRPPYGLDQAVAWTDMNTGDLGISEFFAERGPNGRLRIDEDTEYFKEQGRIPPFHGRGLDWIITHEFGHMLVRSLRRPSSWLTAAWSVAEQAARKLGYTYPQQMAEHVSRYSLMSPDEFVADAFAMVRLGLHPSPEAKAVHDILVAGR